MDGAPGEDRRRECDETAGVFSRRDASYTRPHIHRYLTFHVTVFHRLSTMRDQPLSYTFVPGRSEGTMILNLDGPLTLSNMFALQDELRTIKPQALVVDLSGSPYMDSAGLGLIMNYYVSAENNGRKLLLAGTSERIQALLEMTKVDGVLKSFRAVEEAEASL